MLTITIAVAVSTCMIHRVILIIIYFTSYSSWEVFYIVSVSFQYWPILTIFYNDHMLISASNFLQFWNKDWIKLSLFCIVSNENFISSNIILFLMFGLLEQLIFSVLCCFNPLSLFLALIHSSSVICFLGKCVGLSSLNIMAAEETPVAGCGVSL